MHLITHIPFEEFLGKIFRGPMPFGPYDPDEQVFKELESHAITTVVMLVSDEEALLKAKRKLRDFYQQNHLKVVYLPIEDFDTPDRQALNKAIKETLQLAKQGENILIHCSAGCGRTGLFLAEFTKLAKNIAGDEAIAWVRKFVPCALETQEQIDFVQGGNKLNKIS